jgi:hypothetical protein
VKRYNNYFIPAIPINDDFNFCKPPPPALETDGTEDCWRTELAAKKAVSVPKKRVAVPKEWIYFVSICFLGRHINQ